MRWGTDDCAMWCARILREAYGVDLGKGWRNQYRGKKGAARVLSQSRGLAGALARTCRRNGWVRIDPEDAEPGDLGLFITRDGGPACAVNLAGPAAWIGRVEHGVAYVKLPPRFAWRAPECRR